MREDPTRLSAWLHNVASLHTKGSIHENVSGYASFGHLGYASITVNALSHNSLGASLEKVSLSPLVFEGIFAATRKNGQPGTV